MKNDILQELRENNNFNSYHFEIPRINNNNTTGDVIIPFGIDDLDYIKNTADDFASWHTSSMVYGDSPFYIILYIILFTCVFGFFVTIGFTWIVCLIVLAVIKSFF